VGILASALGLLRPGDPSFAGAWFFPQALVATVAASLLGLGPGTVALSAAALSAWLLPLAASALGAPVSPSPAAVILAAAPGPAAAALAAVAAAGSIRDAAERRARRLMARFRELVHRDTRLSKMTDTLILLNEELETKVSSQRESVSTLYSRIRKMDNPILKESLSGLLGAVRFFAQADLAGVYEFDRKTGALLLQAWTGRKPPASLPLEGSIEGWVYRNETAFSLRMLESYPNLAKMDERRSILAYPLRAGEMPWGVLNVESMSFYRYNPVTEKNLEIVVALAAGYIKSAVDFRERVLLRPRNEVTGMPGYVELTHLLSEELARRKLVYASLSLVLMEFLDYQKLVFAHSGIRVLGLVKEVAEAASREGHVLVFHYKEESQVAFVLPGVDRDGAALFCLEATEVVSSGTWQIDGEELRLEPAFGIASAGEGTELSPFLAEAERILSLSRQAAAAREAI
jgi:putative methionine-R-sulfoxide reductase with GAF domain